MIRANKIRVLVVEDSNVVRMALVHILNSDPELEVISTARNGLEALEILVRQTPDVVLMDIEMPQMDGLEATRRIMATKPIPIVICSGGVSPRQTMTTFSSLEAGAVACVEKPLGPNHKDFPNSARELLRTVKLMSEVKVVHRWPRPRPAPVRPADAPPILFRPPNTRIELVGIGASTGGPPVLQAILAGLPKNFPVPLLVVQHIIRGFLGGLAEWLNRTTGVSVHIAENETRALPGHVYLAPDDCHMAVRPGARIRLDSGDPVDGMRPAVARLFDSLADFYGPASIGVLLSGMGKDGAAELKRMRQRGAATIAQDRETSVVHGMPGEAIAIGAADCVLPADLIAGALTSLVNRKPFAEGCLS
jgi:two-component system chemotaxis response regulator CheB